MKSLLTSILMLCSIALQAQPFSTINFQLRNFTSQNTTNRAFTIAPVQGTLVPPPGVQAPYDPTTLISDASGQASMSNVIEGLYTFTILAPPSRYQYLLFVPTNAPNMYTADQLIVSNNFQFTNLYYTAQAADARFIQITNLIPGSGITIVTNTNASGFTTLTISSGSSINTNQFIASNNGFGTNTTFAGGITVQGVATNAGVKAIGTTWNASDSGGTSRFSFGASSADMKTPGGTTAFSVSGTGDQDSSTNLIAPNQVVWQDSSVLTRGYGRSNYQGTNSNLTAWAQYSTNAFTGTNSGYLVKEMSAVGGGATPTDMTNAAGLEGQIGVARATTGTGPISLWIASSNAVGNNAWNQQAIDIPQGIRQIGNGQWGYDSGWYSNQPNAQQQSLTIYTQYGHKDSTIEAAYAWLSTNNNNNIVQPQFRVIDGNPWSGAPFLGVMAAFTNSIYGSLAGTNDDGIPIYVNQFGFSMGEIGDAYKVGETNQAPSDQIIGNDDHLPMYFSHNSGRPGDRAGGQVSEMILDWTNMQASGYGKIHFPLQIANVYMPSNANYQDVMQIIDGPIAPSSYGGGSSLIIASNATMMVSNLIGGGFIRNENGSFYIGGIGQFAWGQHSGGDEVSGKFAVDTTANFSGQGPWTFDAYNQGDRFGITVPNGNYPMITAGLGAPWQLGHSSVAGLFSTAVSSQTITADLYGDGSTVVVTNNEKLAVQGAIIGASSISGTSLSVTGAANSGSDSTGSITVTNGIPGIRIQTISESLLGGTVAVPFDCNVPAALSGTITNNVGAGVALGVMGIKGFYFEGGRSTLVGAGTNETLFIYTNGNYYTNKLLLAGDGSTLYFTTNQTLNLVLPSPYTNCITMLWSNNQATAISSGDWTLKWQVTNSTAGW